VSARGHQLAALSALAFRARPVTVATSVAGKRKPKAVSRSHPGACRSAWRPPPLRRPPATEATASTAPTPLPNAFLRPVSPPVSFKPRSPLPTYIHPWPYMPISEPSSAARSSRGKSHVPSRWVPAAASFSVSPLSGTLLALPSYRPRSSAHNGLILSFPCPPALHLPSLSTIRRDAGRQLPVQHRVFGLSVPPWEVWVLASEYLVVYISRPGLGLPPNHETSSLPVFSPNLVSFVRSFVLCFICCRLSARELYKHTASTPRSTHPLPLRTALSSKVSLA
jgi:hypothetical protein